MAVRKKCAELHEDDTECLSSIPYNYTTLINLKDIIENDRELFQKRMPLGPTGKKPDMQAISKKLTRLNKIRNRLMHPVGATPPSEEDFFFVKEIQKEFNFAKWRK